MWKVIVADTTSASNLASQRAAALIGYISLRNYLVYIKIAKQSDLVTVAAVETVVIGGTVILVHTTQSVAYSNQNAHYLMSLPLTCQTLLLTQV